MVILFIYVTVFVACVDEPGKQVRKPTPLLAGIESYQSFQEVQKHVLLAEVEWKVISQSKLSDKGFCPRFDNLTISVPFTHLDHQGEAWFQFINEKLFATLFFPDDFSYAYRKDLEMKFGLFQDGDESELLPYTQIWIATMFNKGQYVGWEDKRLDEEIEQYILKCT